MLKLNVIQYKIEKSDVEIVTSFFNIIDIQEYNKSTENAVILPNSIIGKYNIFTDSEYKH